MGRNCCGCNASTSKEATAAGIHFFHFPLKKPKLYKKWVAASGQNTFRPKAHSLLCSRHFEEDCFERKGNMYRLKDNAIPTKFNFSIPPDEASSTLNPTGLPDDSINIKKRCLETTIDKPLKRRKKDISFESEHPSEDGINSVVVTRDTSESCEMTVGNECFTFTSNSASCISHRNESSDHSHPPELQPAYEMNSDYEDTVEEPPDLESQFEGGGGNSFSKFWLVPTEKINNQLHRKSSGQLSDNELDSSICISTGKEERDEVDGQMFLSFLSEADLEDYTIQEKITSQKIRLKKTTDYRQIKGWRYKFGQLSTQDCDGHKSDCTSEASFQRSSSPPIANESNSSLLEGGELITDSLAQYAAMALYCNLPAQQNEALNSSPVTQQSDQTNKTVSTEFASPPNEATPFPTLKTKLRLKTTKEIIDDEEDIYLKSLKIEDDSFPCDAIQEDYEEYYDAPFNGISFSKKCLSSRCGYLYCRMGCVCDSLKVIKQPIEHCGLPECMIQCVCGFRKDRRVSRNSFFSLLKGNESFYRKIDWTSQRHRRERKVPERYRDSVFHLDGDIIVSRTIGEDKAVLRKQLHLSSNPHRSPKSLPTSPLREKVVNRKAESSPANPEKPQKEPFRLKIFADEIKLLRWDSYVGLSKSLIPSDAKIYCMEHEVYSCHCLETNRRIIRISQKYVPPQVRFSSSSRGKNSESDRVKEMKNNLQEFPKTSPLAPKVNNVARKHTHRFKYSGPKKLINGTTATKENAVSSEAAESDSKSRTINASSETNIFSGIDHCAATIKFSEVNSKESKNFIGGIYSDQKRLPVFAKVGRLLKEGKYRLDHLILQEKSRAFEEDIDLSIKQGETLLLVAWIRFHRIYHMDKMHIRILNRRTGPVVLVMRPNEIVASDITTNIKDMKGNDNVPGIVKELLDPFISPLETARFALLYCDGVKWELVGCLSIGNLKPYVETDSIGKLAEIQTTISQSPANLETKLSIKGSTNCITSSNIGSPGTASHDVKKSLLYISKIKEQLVKCVSLQPQQNKQIRTIGNVGKISVPPLIDGRQVTKPNVCSASGNEINSQIPSEGRLNSETVMATKNSIHTAMSNKVTVMGVMEMNESLNIKPLFPKEKLTEVCRTVSSKGTPVRLLKIAFEASSHYQNYAQALLPLLDADDQYCMVAIDPVPDNGLQIPGMKISIPRSILEQAAQTAQDRSARVCFPLYAIESHQPVLKKGFAVYGMPSLARHVFLGPFPKDYLENQPNMLPYIRRFPSLSPATESLTQQPVMEGSGITSQTTDIIREILSKDLLEKVFLTVLNRGQANISVQSQREVESPLPDRVDHKETLRTPKLIEQSCNDISEKPDTPSSNQTMSSLNKVNSVSNSPNTKDPDPKMANEMTASQKSKIVPKKETFGSRGKTLQLKPKRVLQAKVLGLPPTMVYVITDDVVVVKHPLIPKKKLSFSSVSDVKKWLQSLSKLVRAGDLQVLNSSLTVRVKQEKDEATEQTQSEAVIDQAILQNTSVPATLNTENVVPERSSRSVSRVNSPIGTSDDDSTSTSSSSVKRSELKQKQHIRKERERRKVMGELMRDLAKLIDSSNTNISKIGILCKASTMIKDLEQEGRDMNEEYRALELQNRSLVNRRTELFSDLPCDVRKLAQYLLTDTELPERHVAYSFPEERSRKSKTGKRNFRDSSNFLSVSHVRRNSMTENLSYPIESPVSEDMSSADSTDESRASSCVDSSTAEWTCFPVKK